MENTITHDSPFKTKKSLLSISKMENGTSQNYHYDSDLCHVLLLKSTPFQNDFILSIHGYCEADLSYNLYGKGYLENTPSFHVNLSHSSDLAVCASFTSEVGVDVEKLESADLEIAKHYFTHFEAVQVLNAQNPEREFYHHWVLKESYLKAKGLGLNMALDKFEIRTEVIPKAFENHQKMPYSFDFKEFENYFLAVCIQGPLPSISYYETSIRL
jgi:phosphopantetheine--protein transferase-like protein